jgi:hypothetical protein
MKAASLWLVALVALVSMPPLSASGDGPQAPQVKVPEPGVPQMMTLEGTWTRVAYNNEGYAIIGYRLANMSLGEDWMLIEFGTTLRDGIKNYTLKREALSLETPDGKTLPLPTVQEYRKANLTALKNREKVQRDSINYFPPSASQACRIGFFSDIDERPMAWDEVELSSTRGCVGRLFFQIPGGIQYGQHWLNVKFEQTLVRVPFRILTKDEEKLVSKNFKDIKKQVEAAFKKKTS